ncbi:putative synaptic vesicle glycoprotein 2C isoform X2 [Apostichopus japonicus]|uniref:Putative synaptic vesicle glycoprotein 2C isoform X2 n=1 Tax=Stichopus japonicus TaxID=307972 RepID=A0A2G8JV76_STIJA|nr:putative synaptic vesicle glycoprotein 2C isoform X2 [Apostichopus japonicus]
MISALSTCWMLGNILTAGLAWWIIPSQIGYKQEKFSYQSWRVFIAVCVLPAASSAISFMFLPESPKFLLEVGKEEQALSVLKKLYQSNNKASNLKEYRIKHLISSSKTHNQVKRRSESRTSSVVQVINTTLQLFHTPLLRISIALMVIVFCLSFGYYGLWMWFPQIFAEVEYNNGTACSTGKVPAQATDSVAVYKDAFLTALSNLPGNVITILFIDRLGRRFLMAFSLILSGVSVFFIWFVTTRIQVLMTSLSFGGASVIAWNTLNVLGVELYPTHLRSTALGVQSVLNRIGAMRIVQNVTITSFCDMALDLPIIWDWIRAIERRREEGSRTTFQSQTLSDAQQTYHFIVQQIQ